MKSYPSIKRYHPDRHADFQGHTFAKLDGSNLRFEWNHKFGWFRFGSRRKLLDSSHPQFGKAMKMFMDEFAHEFSRQASDNNWKSILVYCEFWGEQSFAGEHQIDDPKFLTPIDVAIYKQGLLPVADFLELYNDKFDLHYLGQRKWCDQFVRSVQNSTLPNMPLEGVIGKTGAGHDRLAIKLKSKAWIQQVTSRFDSTIAAKILNS